MHCGQNNKEKNETYNSELIHLLLQPSLTPLWIRHCASGRDTERKESTTLPVKGSRGYCLNLLKETHLPQ